MTDVFGRIVDSQEINASRGLNSIDFSKDLPQGIYNYSIVNKEKTLSKIMLISR